jgi:excisionase family DNA binding protein
MQSIPAMRYPYLNMSDDFISFEEAARHLELDIVTFTRLVKDSEMRIVRVEGAKRQVSRADLEAVVERFRIEPGTVNRHPSAGGQTQARHALALLGLASYRKRKAIRDQPVREQDRRSEKRPD